jgi:hypothetical protein
MQRTLTDLKGRIARLERLATGLAQEAERQRRAEDLLLFRERKQYQGGIQGALAGAEGARVVRFGGGQEDGGRPNPGRAGGLARSANGTAAGKGKPVNRGQGRTPRKGKISSAVRGSPVAVKGHTRVWPRTNHARR